jgi:hypothetical protein
MGGCRLEVQYLTPDHLQGFDNYKVRVTIYISLLIAFIGFES